MQVILYTLMVCKRSLDQLSGKTQTCMGCITLLGIAAEAEHANLS